MRRERVLMGSLGGAWNVGGTMRRRFEMADRVAPSDLQPCLSGEREWQWKDCWRRDYSPNRRARRRRFAVMTCAGCLRIC